MANEQVAVIDELSSSLVLDIFTTGETRKFAIKTADPAETARRIAARDLNASSLDELLGGGEVLSGKNYTNKPFTLTSVEWQVSEFEGESTHNFYAIMHIVDMNGEAQVLSCGANTVMRKVAIMDAKGWLPAPVKLIKGPKTDAGYEPLDIVKAPEIQSF